MYKSIGRKAGISFIALFLVTISIQSCMGLSVKKTKYIPSTAYEMDYMGRCDKTDTATIMYWPGSSVSINFEGTAISAKLKNGGANIFYYIIDGKPQKKMQPDTIAATYILAKDLKPGKHRVQLFKLTEAQYGSAAFYGFTITEGDALPPSAPHKKKIEFYGNSITCGYALDDTIGDAGKPEYENNYYSYAAITARHYDAAYSCVAKSGIGLMLSWFPIIMPEMYDRIDPLDSSRKWNFTRYTPQVVVVNLLQNDSWLVKKKEHEQFIARFGTTPPNDQYIIRAYKKFITTIRVKYPDATIICALGSMDATKEGSEWPGYIEKAIAEIKDAKVLTCFFPYKNTPGHPKRKEQQEMADQLIRFIDTHVNW